MAMQVVNKRKSLAAEAPALAGIDQAGRIDQAR
jgi:hypothetical protein